MDVPFIPAAAFSYEVEEKDQGLRLDKFLVAQANGLSRTRLQELIATGFVCINSRPFKDASFKVKEGQFIEVTIPPLLEALPIPQNIPLDILYEDDEVVVINKPAGMVVHPAPGHREWTLVNALLNHCGKSLSGIGGVIRPGIVHRLDKETSGLLVVAKNDRAHQSLARQLVTREMGRTYQAVAWGMLLPSEGEIEGPIGRDPYHRQRMTIRFVECELETGRTHQIRVHLAAKSHALLGDILYGRAPRTLPLFLKNYLKEAWPYGRHALHAKSLSFIHPVTQEKLDFSTDLPEDIRILLDVLNSHQY
jgi:23S rRNA pseudouridine1911/1915/1917 synthase